MRTRKLHWAGIPLYVDWDHWAAHYKKKKPAVSQDKSRRKTWDAPTWTR